MIVNGTGWFILKITGRDRKTERERLKVPKALSSGSCTTDDVRSLRGIQVCVFIFFILFLPPLPSGAVKSPSIAILRLCDDPHVVFPSQSFLCMEPRSGSYPEACWPTSGCS